MNNHEFQATTFSGYALVGVWIFCFAAMISILISAPVSMKAYALLIVPLLVLISLGFFMVNPNESRVLQLFGKYVGTEKCSGLRWANPFYGKTKVSTRVRNFESGTLKVNDKSGNPIEIAAVVVWRVVDTAEAIFEVDDYQNFVTIQSEAAIRDLATQHPYDNSGEDSTQICLRSDVAEVATLAREAIDKRLDKAGIDVIEARISHLAYAPEIAQAMLRRQQASAVVAARHKIVEGAVGMVESALDKLKDQNVIDLDEERKASMVSNLMVVLCSDQNTQPVVNTGSLYS